FTTWYSGCTSVLSGATTNSPLISGCRHTVMRSTSPGRSTGSLRARAGRCPDTEERGTKNSAATAHPEPRLMRFSPVVTGASRAARLHAVVGCKERADGTVVRPVLRRLHPCARVAHRQRSGCCTVATGHRHERSARRDGMRRVTTTLHDSREARQMPQTRRRWVTLRSAFSGASSLSCRGLCSSVSRSWAQSLASLASWPRPSVCCTSSHDDASGRYPGFTCSQSCLWFGLG